MKKVFLLFERWGVRLFESIGEILVLAGNRISGKQSHFEELDQKLAETQRLLEKKNNAAEDLRSKLLSARDALKRKQSAVDVLQDRLLRCRELLNNKNDRLKSLDEQANEAEHFDTVGHNSSEGMNSFFKEVAVESPYIKFGQSVVELLEKENITLNNKSVADYGVGPGIALATIIESYTPKQIFGFDFSSQAIEIAKSNIPAGDFSVRDIYQPSQMHFDVVLCTEVLEHLEYPERALTNMVDALNIGGSLVLTVPDGRMDRSKYHINFWSIESWQVFISAVCPSHYELRFGTFGSKTHKKNLYAVVDAK